MFQHGVNGSINEDFEVVFTYYLGDKQEVTTSYKLFKNWEEIRNEVVQLIIALESGNLSFLTIDANLYTAQQAFFDEWDAGFLNDLTVVPEPCTLLLIGIGGLVLRKRK